MLRADKLYQQRNAVEKRAQILSQQAEQDEQDEQDKQDEQDERNGNGSGSACSYPALAWARGAGAPSWAWAWCSALRWAPECSPSATVAATVRPFPRRLLASKLYAF